MAHGRQAEQRFSRSYRVKLLRDYLCLQAPGTDIRELEKIALSLRSNGGAVANLLKQVCISHHAHRVDRPADALLLSRTDQS